MSAGLAVAIILVTTALARWLTKKVAPKLGSHRLYAIAINLLTSLALTLKAMPEGASLDWAILLDVLIKSAEAAGIFSLLKNGIQGAVDVKKVRMGASISTFLVVCLPIPGLSGCITVPFKGEHELTCTLTRNEGGTECLVCAADVTFEDAGKRHVEQTMCIGPAATPGAP